MQGDRKGSDIVLSGASGRRATVVYYPSVAFAATARRSVETMVMTAAVVTLTVAQLLDLGTFIRMIDRHGIAVEANPLVSHLVSEFGLPFVAVAKIVALSLVVAVTVVLAESTPDRRRPSPSRPAGRRSCGGRRADGWLDERRDADLTPGAAARSFRGPGP